MRRIARRPSGVPLFLLLLPSSLLFFSPARASVLSYASEALRNLSRIASRERPQESAPPVIDYFRAYPATESIKLVWSVFSEKDVAGFRVYRSSRSDGSFAVVSGQGLIPAWHQELMDGAVTSSTMYRYVLGVAFADGTEFLSQPVESYPK